MVVKLLIGLLSQIGARVELPHVAYDVDVVREVAHLQSLVDIPREEGEENRDGDGEPIER